MLRSAGGMSQSAADSRYSQLPTSKVVAPTTGQTVSFDNNSLDQLITINPAGSLSALTITFPSDASSRIGQEIKFATMQAIVALTLSGGVIMNPVGSLVAGDSFTFTKVNTNTWMLDQ